MSYVLRIQYLQVIIELHPLEGPGQWVNGTLEVGWREEKVKSGAHCVRIYQYQVTLTLAVKTSSELLQ